MLKRVDIDGYDTSGLQLDCTSYVNTVLFFQPSPEVIIRLSIFLRVSKFFLGDVSASMTSQIPFCFGVTVTFGAHAL